MRHVLILLLALVQVGCYVNEDPWGYKPVGLSSEWQQSLELMKREYLILEDLKIGHGPTAAVGRKIAADIEVRYASGDGNPIYQGPAVAYFGMQGDVFIHNGEAENGMLSLQQQGIILGLNGMNVGGKRRITVYPNLICYEGAIGEFTSQGADPNVSCTLVRYNKKIRRPITVRKEKLIVEATLTDSCTPIFLEIPFIYYGQFRCRNSESPRFDTSAPIWRIY